MTVSRLAKLEAALRATPRGDEAATRASTQTMRRAAVPPEAMAPEFSGLNRAVHIIHAKFHGERSVLTVGAESTGIAS
jgi:hypothetical protein